MKIEKLSNFSKICNQYDVFLIDLWGVMHNGIRLNPGAIKTVENLSNNNKKIIFLSNAPRPAKHIVGFLKNVLTSGEAAMNSLKENKFGAKFYHLGPERDDSLFFEIKKIKLH